MKKALSFLVVSACLLFAAPHVWADCTLTPDPSGPDTITGSCVGSSIVTRPLAKMSHWNLYMAANGTVYPEYSMIGYQTSGTGECRTGTLNQAACWPDFFSPTVIYPSGTATAVFEQRVKSYEVVSVEGWWNCVTTDDHFWSEALNCPRCPGQCDPFSGNPPPFEQGIIIGTADYCRWEDGCPNGSSDQGGCCIAATPLLIDVAGNGLALTDAKNGVHFDMGGDGHQELIAWTSSGSDDAWLALDRNGNGLIDNAKELFGNFTDQPNATTLHNGFLAMAEFDRTEKGGNSDGQIDPQDAVFQSLLLWRDTNHNGVSEPTELYTLPQLGLRTMDLDYKTSKRVDEHGNQFVYRAKIKDVHGAQLGRWAWDVILATAP